MEENVLDKIKEEVKSFVGHRVSVKANRGRRKAVEKEGVLEKTHENVFVVRINDHNQIRRLSYTYSDLLTDDVVVKSKDDEVKIGV
ncbi:Veg family protein [Halanaerobium saccharolyticum]|uniref:Veg family protein n=1 Tax=Halanaerobium saccharolyticum TaxID=43595 RepID=UPI003FCEE198